MALRFVRARALFRRSCSTQAAPPRDAKVPNVENAVAQVQVAKQGKSKRGKRLSAPYLKYMSASTFGKLQEANLVPSDAGKLERIGATLGQSVGAEGVPKVVRASPRVMELEPAALEEYIAVLRSLGLEGNGLKRALQKKGSISSEARDTVIPNVKYLQSVGVPADCIIKLLPALREMKLEDVKRKLEVMLGLGMKGRTLGFALRTGRILRTVDAEEVQKVAEQLRAAGMSSAALPKIMLWNYRLLKPDDHCEELGLAYQKRLSKNVACLQELGFSAETATKMIEKCPSLLLAGGSSIAQKVKYLNEEMQIPVDVIAKHPTLLTRSVHKRFRPRKEVLEFLKAEQVVVKDYAASTLLASSNKAFAAMVARLHPKAADVFRSRWTAASEDEKVTVSV